MQKQSTPALHPLNQATTMQCPILAVQWRLFPLENITVGYTVPKHLTEKLSIKSLRIYLSANDILCFSKYPKGWDPENSSDVIGGTDNKDFYPITRSILGGINIKF